MKKVIQSIFVIAFLAVSWSPLEAIASPILSQVKMPAFVSSTIRVHENKPIPVYFRLNIGGKQGDSIKVRTAGKKALALIGSSVFGAINWKSEIEISAAARACLFWLKADAQVTSLTVDYNGQAEEVALNLGVLPVSTAAEERSAFTSWAKQKVASWAKKEVQIVEERYLITPDSEPQLTGKVLLNYTKKPSKSSSVILAGKAIDVIDLGVTNLQDTEAFLKEEVEFLLGTKNRSVVYLGRNQANGSVFLWNGNAVGGNGSAFFLVQTDPGCQCVTEQVDFALSEGGVGGSIKINTLRKWTQGNAISFHAVADSKFFSLTSESNAGWMTQTRRQKR